MKFVGELNASQQSHVETCNSKLNDPERLLALQMTGLMDTPREDAFDRLCRLAARILNVPLSIVSLVNNKKQFFKGDYGLPHPFSESRELPIDFSLCRYTMAGDAIISSDASQDAFLKFHPSTIPWGIGSLIVLPLITPEGHVLGTFCVIQPTPREWTDLDLEVMKELTASIMTEINLRQQISKLRIEHNQRDTLLAAVTHDLRTPLTVTKMTAQMMAKKYSDNKDIHNSVLRITNSIERSEKMIQDLLDVNNIKSGSALIVELEDCRVDEIAKMVLQELTLLYGNRFVFKTDKTPSIKADRMAIRRMIENLASNAAKYSIPGTEIEISLVKSDRFLEINFENQGTPISLEDQSNIFEPFHRTVDATRSNQKGWGLGLPLVRGLVEAHKGYISVTSSIETGTCFKISLPL